MLYVANVTTVVVGAILVRSIAPGWSGLAQSLAASVPLAIECILDEPIRLL